MKRFIDLKISTKLVIGFLIIAIIGTIIGAVGLTSLYMLWRDDRQMYIENTQALEYAGDASTTFVLIRYNTYKLSVLDDDTKIKDAAGSNEKLTASLDDLLAKCDGIIATDEFRVELSKIKSEWENDYKPGMQELTKLAMSGKQEAAQALIPKLAELGTGMFDEFTNFLALLSQDASDMADNNAAVALGSAIAIVAVMVLGFVVSVLLAVYIARIISKPLHNAVQIANKLAVGDLDADMNTDNNRQDEIGKLNDSFQQLLNSTKKQVQTAKIISEGDLTIKVDLRSEKDQLGQGLSNLVTDLRDLVSSIYAAAEQVSDGSNMLSNSSMALSQGATEQASAVQELTASIEEIAAQTQINSENAESANELATSSKLNAEQGNEQMKSMLAAMDEINNSSKNIGRIIKVIDDIAFQTNILALNAAVEAARAGQHGKGFAVVAEEVRTLASKSANAVKETTDMIESSMRKVEAGTKIAAETAESLSRIVGQIERAAELNNAIARASKEQAVGIDQVNKGIIQVSQVVQTNAATSEESAAASEQLSSQAEHLKEIVSAFNIGNGQEAVRNKKPVINLGTGSRYAAASKQLSLSGDSDFGKY